MAPNDTSREELAALAHTAHYRSPIELKRALSFYPSSNHLRVPRHASGWGGCGWKAVFRPHSLIPVRVEILED